jgi:PAS domain S-box-containing protein
MDSGELGESAPGGDGRGGGLLESERTTLLRRIRGLECRCAVDQLLAADGTTAALAEQIAGLLRAALEYPEGAEVRVDLGSPDAAVLQSAPAWVRVHRTAVTQDSGVSAGTLSAWYATPGIRLTAEDRQLLAVVARSMGAWMTRRAAERDLNEHVMQYRALIDSLPQRVFIKDRASRYVTMNNKLAADYGATPMTWPGTTDYAYHPPELAEKYRADDQRIMAEDITESFDEEYVREGERRIIHTYKSPVRNAAGEIIGVLGVFDDVTELRQAVEQLRVNRARYRTLMDSIPQRVFIKDLTGRFVVMNQRMAEELGTTPDETVGKREDDFLAPDVAARHHADDARILATGLSESVDEACMVAGERRYINTYKTPVRASSGDIIGLLVVISDITARKQSEEALRASSAEMRTLLEHVPAVTYRAPVESLHTTSYVSPQVESLLGYDAAHFFGNPNWWQDALHPEDREHVLTTFRRAGATGAPVQMEFRFVRRDGRVVWCRNHAVRVHDDLEKPPYYLGFLIDITAERQAQSENAGLAAAVRQAGESIEITDRKGIVLYVNPAHQVASGYAAEELMGNRINMLKSGRHDASFYGELWGTLNRGETWKGTLINRRKDGSIYEEEATISPVFDGGGQATSFVAVKRDVTVQRELERQMRQTEKMQAIGTLAGGIAHDMNNVLAAIMGHTELALEELSRDSQVVEDLTDVLKAAHRARDLVQQILTFSRQGEEIQKRIRLQDVIAEALRLLRPSIPSTIAVREHIDADCPAIMADGSQMHQIVMNLCTNAYHAMRDRGGVLTVLLDTFEVEEEFAALHTSLKPGPHVRMSVQDTGRGMSHELQERIFEPFFTTKPKGEGTGLGLSTVHGIVTSQRGVIVVYSEPDQGARFSILLPSAGALAMPSGASDAVVRRGTERVIVVDDERDLGVLIERALSRQGYVVERFEESVAALDAVRQDPARYDLVITDQTMPGLTGLDLACELLKVRADLPIILTTGFSESATAEAARALGIKAFLMKPARPKEVAAMVRDVLDRQRGESKADAPRA